MTKDILYIFDKITRKRNILGEIQSSFNMSFVIDGTKDSWSAIVWSFEENEIEPYTILNHPKTNTWWVVSHDKVERYTNENGFLYIHNLEMVGAIDLLNARDLTDCGFNSWTYTIRRAITRLAELSSLEYPFYISSSVDQNFLDQPVAFIKTFENYTLLSAIREFLDAYNMCPKLTFVQEHSGNNYYLDRAILHIVPKTGSKDLETHNIDFFDATKETKTLNKNSFGTTVVSNAENVTSSALKRFPATGGAKVSSTTNKVDYDTAVLRLPSKVFKGDWIKILHGIKITIVGTYDGNAYGPDEFYYFPYGSKHLLEKHMETIFDTYNYPTAIVNDFWNKFDKIIDELNKGGTTTLYEGNDIVPTYPDAKVVIQKGANVPYLAYAYDRKSAGYQPLVFVDKDTINILPKSYLGIAWERGSNLISNFDLFETGLGKGFELRTFYFTDLHENNDNYTFYQSANVSNHSIQIGCNLMVNNQGQLWELKNSSFIVSYYPMNDIKIKVDNIRDKNDIQLYNQNGKLTDSVALSKIINSYAKEISSDTITKFKSFTNLNNVPEVGSFVHNNNETYVINNISMTFTRNETNLDDNFNYFIDCEFTMSKYCSTKSAMVNPNTNIRDYGIPQNYNVKRKQLYRDYYELNYGQLDDADRDYYYAPENIFNLGHYPNSLPNFIAVIKTSLLSSVNGSNVWYYQLETTNYYLDKMLYVVLDFNDNNIIGYGSQNVFSGFDISRILTGLTDTINTPISYVGNDGRVLGFDILLMTTDELIPIYDTYQEENSGSSWTGTLYNYSVFIPQEIYDNSVDFCAIRISEPAYYKDALEVPVFEYVCQVDDSEDVLVGDGILNQHNGFIYFYSYVVGEDLTQYNTIDPNTITAISNPLGWSLDNGCEIQYEILYNIPLLRIRIYNNQVYNLNDQSFVNYTQRNFEEGKDYAIFRHAFNTSTQEEIVELMFIAKAIPDTHITSNNLLTLELNHYKLK